jgi:hypothetical protein
VSLFIESGAKAKLSIYNLLLSDFEEFKKLTCPIKSTEYSYLQQSRFFSLFGKEEISLSQFCILGHGFNEDIYLIGEDIDVGILERKLYATFSYSLNDPIEFIIIPIQHYYDSAGIEIIKFFSSVVRGKAKIFRWQSLIKNPYNKVYDELINIFSGDSALVNDHFIEYSIINKNNFDN